MFLAIGFLVLRTPKLVAAQGFLGFTGVYWGRTFGAYWGALRVSVLILLCRLFLLLARHSLYAASALASCVGSALNSQLSTLNSQLSTTHYSLLTTHYSLTKTPLRISPVRFGSLCGRSALRVAWQCRGSKPIDFLACPNSLPTNLGTGRHSGCRL